MNLHRSIQCVLVAGLVVFAAGCQHSYRQTAQQVVDLELTGRYAEATSTASQAAAENRVRRLQKSRSDESRRNLASGQG